MRTIALLLGIVVASAPVLAQMYKWVDKDGKTHYTDMPPPAEAKKLDAPKGSSARSVPVPVASAAQASQATRVFESALVGVRLTLPAEWPADDRTHDASVNCAPKIESRPGMPGCYFTVGKSKLAPGQTEITDANRAKWRGWAVGEGLGRVFVSARDVTVAGYVAHEVLVREDNKPNAALSMRLVVLIPGFQFVDFMHYAYWDDRDQSAATRPAVRAALETLKPSK